MCRSSTNVDVESRGVTELERQTSQASTRIHPLNYVLGTAGGLLGALVGIFACYKYNEMNHTPTAGKGEALILTMIVAGPVLVGVLLSLLLAKVTLSGAECVSRTVTMARSRAQVSPGDAEERSPLRINSSRDDDSRLSGLYGSTSMKL
jgi:hypothetical protein